MHSENGLLTAAPLENFSHGKNFAGGTRICLNATTVILLLFGKCAEEQGINDFNYL